MTDFQTAFKGAFSGLKLEDFDASSLGLDPRICRISSDAAKLTPRYSVALDSTAMAPDLIRWLTRREVKFSTSFVPSPSASERADLYIYLAKKTAYEPKLNEKNGLVTVYAGTTVKELTSYLAQKGFTMGAVGNALDDATMQSLAAGEVFAEPFIAGAPFKAKIMSCSGVLSDGFPFKTHAIPRSATGPDFKQLFIGSFAKRSLITELVLSVSKKSWGDMRYWRWLKLQSLQEAVTFAKSLARAGYPVRGLKMTPDAKGFIDLFLAYSDDHPLNAPLMEKIAQTAESMYRSEPYGNPETNLIPDGIDLYPYWYWYAVSYSDLNRFIAEITKSAAKTKSKFKFELYKPQHEYIFVRIMFDALGGDGKAEKTLKGANLSGLYAKRLYPETRDATTNESAKTEEWRKSLNL